MWTESLGDGRKAIYLEPKDVETYVRRGLEQDGITNSSVEVVGALSINTYPDGTLSGATVRTRCSKRNDGGQQAHVEP